MYLAEYFPRLDSVIISLDANSVVDPKILYDKNENILNVGNEAIQLPFQSREGDADVKLINLKTDKDKSNISILLKVPTVEQELSSSSFMNYSVPSLSNTTFVQKWSVQDLKERTPVDPETKKNLFSFNCKSCNHKLIDSLLRSFFDLPSELWAEMMEFWHCHKPNIDLKTNLQKTSYYNGVLKPGSSREVIIGNYYLLSRVDCEEDTALLIQDDQCICKYCSHPIGEYLEEISIYNKEMFFRLNKWNLKLEYSKSTDSFTEVYQPYLYVYNLIMDKINSLAVRKFVVNGKLLLWVTNIGINVSTGDKVYSNALKVMMNQDKESKVDEEEEDNVDTFKVPLEVFESLIDILTEINEKLPISNKLTKLKDEEKGYIEYKVSYLPSI